MDVWLSIVIVLVVILGVGFFFIRRKEAAPKQRPAAARPAQAGATTQFHAVAIKLGPTACSAAQNLEGKRFLSNAAPRIPLPDCDVSGCQCRFEHFADRREKDDDDRRNPYRAGMGAETGRFHEEQRLGPRDRRGDRPKKI